MLEREQFNYSLDIPYMIRFNDGQQRHYASLEQKTYCLTTLLHSHFSYPSLFFFLLSSIIFSRPINRCQ